MANNPYVNKVQYGGQTIMDISDTDAEESDVVEGKIFYKGNGQRSVGTGSGGGSSIQVDELPEASVTELGNIYQYVGEHLIDIEYTDDTSNFVGEGDADNYSIVKNNLQLHSMDGGYGMIKCKTPLVNRGTLKITHKGNDGVASYAGMYLGSTMGGSNIYTSPSWDISTTAVTDEIDLSQFDNEEIYVSFRINVASGNRGSWYITSMHHEAEDAHTKGSFYECKSVEESGTTTYYWDEIISPEMPAEDMSEVASPMPSVMSRRFKYSTEEQVVGEWINGKPLYQKTFTGTATGKSTDPWNNVTIDWDANTNITHCIKGTFDASETGGGSGEIDSPVITTNTLGINQRWTGSSITYTYYVTVRYTKTTD